MRVDDAIFFQARAPRTHPQRFLPHSPATCQLTALVELIVREDDRPSGSRLHTADGFEPSSFRLSGARAQEAESTAVHLAGGATLWACGWGQLHA